MSENLPAVPEDNEPLIPRPELHDILQGAEGQEFHLTRDNCVIVEHANGYDYMDHLFLRVLGDIGYRMYGLRASPLYDYLIERGYDRWLKQYPSDITVRSYEQLLREQLDRELDEDIGGELDP